MNYAPEIAGVGKYSGEIGEYLATRGCEVRVITTPPHYPGWKLLGGYGNRWSKEALAGVRIFRCPLYLNERMHGVHRLLAPLSFALSSLPRVVGQILTFRPDVVIVVEPTLFGAPYVLAASKLVGVRTVLHVQDLEIDAAFATGHLQGGDLLRTLALSFERACLQRFDKVITIADAMAARIIAKGVPKNKVAVIRNWVDLDMVRPVTDASAYRAELGLGPDDFIALYSGNIGAKQGVGLLVEAARRLAGERRIVFVVAGQGPMRGEVAKAAKALGNIRLLDFQPVERFSDFLGTADLHLLPQEAGAADLMLPSKLGAMLASGRRIVVTADQGTELASFLGASCLFTPPGDARALADAVRSAAGVAADRRQMDERLALARKLSKTLLIEDFFQAIRSVADRAPAPPCSASKGAV